jgi:hypothetical protein
VRHTHLRVYTVRMARKLTARDVCAASGYSRAELRALLAKIGFWRGRPAQARIANEYIPPDLIVIATIRELEVRCGMSRRAITAIYKQLRSTLSTPRSVNRNARILVAASPPAVTYVNEAVNASEGTSLSLQRVFARVEGHLGTSALSLGQSNLKLGPTVVRQRKPTTRTMRG